MCSFYFCKVNFDTIGGHNEPKEDTFRLHPGAILHVCIHFLPLHSLHDLSKANLGDPLVSCYRQKCHQIWNSFVNDILIKLINGHIKNKYFRQILKELINGLL